MVSIAAQLVSHDLPGLTTVTPYQLIEETLSRSPIALCLQIEVDHFAVLIDSPPEAALLTIGIRGQSPFFFFGVDIKFY